MTFIEQTSLTLQTGNNGRVFLSKKDAFINRPSGKGASFI